MNHLKAVSFSKHKGRLHMRIFYPFFVSESDKAAFFRMDRNFSMSAKYATSSVFRMRLRKSHPKHRVLRKKNTDFLKPQFDN